MAKDERLYARLALDFADSHKIAPLSDAAFRGYVEALLWSRRMLLDGLIPERMAHRMMGAAVLEELSTNDPDSPSLIVVEGGYQIHDFGVHQSTKAEIEELREARRTAGIRGGQASAQARAEAKAKQAASKAPSKSNPETETETFSSKELKSRGTRAPDSFEISNEMRAWASREVPLVDVDKKLGEWLDYWRSVPGQKGVKLDWLGVWRNGMRKQQEFAERDGVGKPRNVKRFNDEAD